MTGSGAQNDLSSLGVFMLSRSLLVVLAVMSLSACDHGDAAASQAPEPPAAAVQTTAPTSPGEAALVGVWQAAHPGEQARGLEALAAAFDPTFAIIANAGNDADNAFIKSTLTFIMAVQATRPGLCAEAPVARFTMETLAAVPAETLPAFRAMLTDRLAVIADGTRHAAPDDLMSGSMQGFTVDLGDGDALGLLPSIAAGAAYDPAAGCAATLSAWQALDKATQSPQLMQSLYSGQL